MSVLVRPLKGGGKKNPKDPFYPAPSSCVPVLTNLVKQSASSKKVSAGRFSDFRRKAPVSGQAEKIKP